MNMKRQCLSVIEAVLLATILCTFTVRYFGEKNILWPIKILILVHALEVIRVFQVYAYSEKML